MSKGVPVLVIPGLDGNTSLLAGALPRLFPGRRTVAFLHHDDLAEGGVAGLAARALGLLDADRTGDGTAYVCGISFGGTVALALARRYPERVRGLILLSAFGWYPSASSHVGRLGMAFWRLMGDRAAAWLIRAWRPLSVSGALGPGCPPDLVRAFLDRPAPHLPAYRAKCAISLAFDARPWLAEIRCPTFVLIGTRDPVVPTSAGRELARRIPNARLHCLPGGHLVHIVRADEAGALISRWMVKHRDRCAEPGSRLRGRWSTGAEAERQD